MELTKLQRLAVTPDIRREWYLALAKIAEDGLPIFDALEKMLVDFQKTKHPLTPLVKAVLLRLRGAGLARVGAKRRTLGTELMGMVPDDEAMLIQAGDTSGQIHRGLRNASKLVETKRALASSVIAAMLKPIGYILAMIGLLTFMSVKMLPQFEKTSPRASWPARTQLLGTISDNIMLITIIVIGGMVLVGAALRWVVPRWTGEMRDRFDEVIFPFPLIAGINGASFLSSIAGYIGAGTPFVDAVRNLHSTGTPYIQSQCEKILEMMRRGKRPEEALCHLAIVPPRFHWIINVYAMSDDASKVYDTIADEMSIGVQAFVRKLFSYVIGNILMIATGLMLFWIYGSMFDIALSGNPL